jgi:3-phenylpropionate/trans-cinnamate dioxygenase alpha subunit
MWVDRDAPAEVKDATRLQYTISHGPSGIREEEDGLNWMGCTSASNSLTGLKYPQNLQLGIGHEDRDERFPGFASQGPNEVNQRFFYKRWAEIMDAPSWAQISNDPITHNRLVTR